MCSSICLGQTLARKQCKSLGQGVGLGRYNSYDLRKMFYLVEIWLEDSRGCACASDNKMAKAVSTLGVKLVTAVTRSGNNAVKCKPTSHSCVTYVFAL